MITFSVLVLSIFVLPIVGSTIAFRYFFPKHAIRISDSYSITIGTSLTILINLPAFYFLFKVIVPNSVTSHLEDMSYYIVRSLHDDVGLLFLIGSTIIIVPVLVAIFCFCMLRFYFWHFYCSNQEAGVDNFKGWSKLRFQVGEFVSNSILNYMAKLTIYDDRNEVLIVDILDNQDSLYSGIFTDFFMEHGKFAGISLASVIRFSFKNEKERKDNKVENHPMAEQNAEAENPSKVIDENAKKQDRPYILPRLGEMYFPSDKIQNLHFWKVRKGHVFQKKVKRPFDEAMIAWYLLLQNTYKKMNFSVKAYVESPNILWPTFTKELENLPLDLSGLEIVTDLPLPEKTTHPK